MEFAPSCGAWENVPSERQRHSVRRLTPTRSSTVGSSATRGRHSRLALDSDRRWLTPARSRLGSGVAVCSGRHSREVGQLKHDDSLATILLVSRLCADGVRPLKASEYWSLLDLIGADPACSSGRGDNAVRGEPAHPREGLNVFLGYRDERVAPESSISEEFADRIRGLMDRAAAVAFEVERLEQSGIKALTAFDEHYPRLWPARLGAKAPPLLHGAGALALLDTPGLGVVGSRDVSQQGGEVAKEVARLAARRGLPLVSGGARGVDQLAMNAALEAGGAVVGILAESLSRKLKGPDVRRAIYDGVTVLCTPYSPDAPFSTGNAMGRNKLIYAQAALTVVVASDDGSGGTWSGATEALNNGYGLVAVWRGDGQGPGNEPLQRRGAIPVTSLADIESVLDNEQAPPSESPPDTPSRPEQQCLFATTRTG